MSHFTLYLRKNKLIANIFRGWILSITLALAAHAHADNTLYYINNNNSSTVQCSDSGTGTSPSSPWCNIDVVNRKTFGPGDVINLARGAVWFNQRMSFDQSASGDSTNHKMTIQAYGAAELNRPHITSTASSGPDQVPYRGIVLQNASHWVIKDLEISHVAVGILFNYKNKGFEDISLSNLTLHHIYGYVKDQPQNFEGIQFSAGILFTNSDLSLVENNGDLPFVRDIVIDQVEGYHNQDTIAIDIGDKKDLVSDYQYQGTAKKNAVKNVWLNHLYLHDEDANGQSDSCSDSLRLVKMAMVTVENSTFDRAAACYSNTGTAAIFLGSTASARIVNNIIRNTPFTLSPNGVASQDQAAIDLEQDNGETQIHGNLIAANGRGAECIVSYVEKFPCLFDITGNGFMNNRNGAMFVYGHENLPVGDLKYNFYYGLPGSHFKYSEGVADDYDAFKSISTTDSNAVETNIPLPNVTDFYSAAADFSGTTDLNTSAASKNWTYEYLSDLSNLANPTWLPLSYDSTLKIWNRISGNQGLYVSQFDMKSVPGQLVARVWTAPKTGLISIIGQVATSQTKQTGKIFARIANGNATIWPSAAAYYSLLPATSDNHKLGVATNVFKLAVQAGDKIRFEIVSNDMNDVASWTPMISYLDGPASIVWNFNTPDWAENWGQIGHFNQLSYSVSTTPNNPEGALKLAITGNDSWIRSRYNLAPLVDPEMNGTSYPFVTLNIKHDKNQNIKAKFSWIIVGDEVWNGAKSKVISLDSTSDYQKIMLNMAGVPTWTGKSIRQLRLDPIDDNTISSGTVFVDYIRLDKVAP